MHPKSQTLLEVHIFIAKCSNKGEVGNTNTLNTGGFLQNITLLQQ